MNLNYLVFTFFISLNIKFQLASLTDSHANDKKIKFQENFQVITDRKQAEKMAVDYAELKKNSGRLKSVFSKIKMRKSICRRSKEIKIEFCAQILDKQFYGFEFDLKEYTDYQCTTKKFSTRSTASIANNFRLPMFSCPDLVYTDLKSDEKTLWSYRYLISKGKTYDSASIFFQQSPDEEIHPDKFVTNISYKSLATHSRLRKTYLPPPPPLQMNRFSITGIEKMIRQYMQTRKIIRPYKKFINFFFSMNICGLRQSQKIHICRRTPEFSSQRTLQSVEERKCRKYSIKFDNRKMLGLERTKLFAFRCSSLPLKKEEITLYHVYVASCSITANVVISFSRINEKGRKLEVKSIFEETNTFSMIQDIRRKNLLLYRSPTQHRWEGQNVFLKRIEDELKRRGNPIQIPLLRMQNENSEVIKQDGELITNKPLIDDFVILFSQIKRTKLVYQKFKTLYRSMDFCQLPSSHKLLLCNDILETHNYKRQRFDHNQNLGQHCRREIVLLNIREAENLETDIFSMWKCPHYTKFGNYYHLGKSHVDNAVMVFKSEAIPETKYTAVEKHYYKAVYPEAAIINTSTEKTTTVNSKL